VIVDDECERLAIALDFSVCLKKRKTNDNIFTTKYHEKESAYVKI
jgi:hypothetical protein